jgi:hypothetical protein
MNDNKAIGFSWSLLLKISAFACFWLFSTLPSFGFCPEPKPTVSCEFLNSDAVFVGKVISARAISPRGKQLDGWLYDLSTQELFRGSRTQVIKVFTENSSGSFPLDVGKQYLIFADELDGRLTITNCGNSALLSNAQDAIRELRSLEISEDAAIEGRISFSGIPDSGTHEPGIEVVVRSDTGTFRATSDRNGRFRLHVPPGKYSAEAQQTARWNIVPFDLSFDHPNHFDARKGHCSALQFIATSK